MAMNLQQIRDYVRTHLDLEEEDLPDDVIDVFIEEGAEKIEQAEQRWPFYEMLTSFQTVANVPYTPSSAMDSRLKRVSMMTIEGRPLQWIDGTAVYERFGNDATGRPTHFSEFGGVTFFHPIPDAAYDVVIFGYRNQDDWMAAGAGAEPDMPSELHNAVANWALFRAYAQQEDPEMAHNYRVLFDEEVATYGRRVNELPLQRPFILNRGNR